MNLFGILRKTAMSRVCNSMNGITPAMFTAMAGSDFCLRVQERRLSSEPETPTLCLSGGSSSTPAGKKASTARYSGTKVRTDRPSLSDKLTQSLITAGLVKGITHTSIRKLSGAPIRDTALWPLDGGVAESELKKVSASLSDSQRDTRGGSRRLGGGQGARVSLVKRCRWSRCPSRHRWRCSGWPLGCW